MSRQDNPGNQPPKERLKQRLLDRYDLQELFNVTRGTIHNWCKKGLLKFIKISGRMYFDLDDMEDMLQEYKQNLVPGEGKKKK
jgi:Helix-turn-helix domain